MPRSTKVVSSLRVIASLLLGPEACRTLSEVSLAILLCRALRNCRLRLREWFLYSSKVRKACSSVSVGQISKGCVRLEFSKDCCSALACICEARTGSGNKLSPYIIRSNFGLCTKTRARYLRPGRRGGVLYSTNLTSGSASGCSKTRHD